MRGAILISIAMFALSACSSATGYSGRRSPDVVIIGDRDRESELYPRRLYKVPRGHYPRRGECRVWYQGRPPGHQPPSVRCGYLRGRVPYGAFILYAGRDWDTSYDWRRYERRHRGSVPRIILELIL
jgi:hypothetical protein